MRVLALDTTTRAGSLALVDEDHLVDEVSGDPSQTHAERLPGKMLALLARHGLTVPDVDLFAVASGPGSFTGLRIGIATIQGLAFTSARPVVAVSALGALAQMASAALQPGSLVAAWMDAHRHDVFAALYRVGADPVFRPGRLLEIAGPTVGDPAGILARWAEHLAETPTWFIGDGTALHGDAIRTARASQVHILPTPLLAGAIGRIALATARRGEAILPGAVRPLYVRRPDAELDRERKAQLGPPQ